MGRRQFHAGEESQGRRGNFGNKRRATEKRSPIFLDRISSYIHRTILA